VVGWYGAFAPAGMPPALADKIRTAIEKVVRQPETRQRILDMGLAPASGAPENFQERILSDLVNWRRVVQQSGISLE
jgi:tripartite-type tricarboxylate transporter receptor subunit TctC